MAVAVKPRRREGAGGAGGCCGEAVAGPCTWQLGTAKGTRRGHVSHMVCVVQLPGQEQEDCASANSMSQTARSPVKHSELLP